MSAESKRPLAALIAAVVIFGTIGVFRRYLPLPSGVIAMARGYIGMAFLLVYRKARGQRFSLADIRRSLAPLLISGACIGFNWILLFEAYRFTSVAVATLCYYMAPVIVILVSPVLLRERLTARKLICVLAALAGMALVSGVAGESGANGGEQWKGVALGLGAALLYAGVVLTNKRITGVGAMDRTVVQLGTAATVLLPYVAAVEGLNASALTPFSTAMLLTVGIVHTGVAYALYFGAIGSLKAQTVALFSYIDPVTAILLSAALLGERMTAPQAIGAALILLATLASELPERKAE